MADRAELLAEAQRRGLVPSQQPSRDDLMAEAQRRGLIKPQAQQPESEPMSKLEAIKQGFGMIKDKVKGNAEFDDAGSFESWQWTQPKLGLNTKNLKTTMAGMFGTDKDKFESFKRNNPDIQIKLDNAKNPYFEDKGKKYYLDMPGLDIGDIADFVGEGATYTAGGALTAPVQGVVKKSLAGGLAQGGANMVNQKLAGREEIDKGEALTSAIGGGIFEGGGQLVNKLRNAKAENLNISDDAFQALNYANKKDLPLYADDITNSGMIKKIGQQLDEVPLIGGNKSREAQNVAQKKIAQETTERFKMPDNQMDDLYSVVNKSAKNQLKTAQKEASKRYDNAYQDLNKIGEFDVPEVKAFAQELMEHELKKGSGANKEILNKLSNYTELNSGNFEYWADIKSDIAGLVRDGSKGVNAQIGSKTTGALKRLDTVLNQRLDEVASSNGGFGGGKWRDANKFYNDEVVKYKKGVLKTAMNEDSPEKMLDLMIGSGGGFGRDSKHVGNTIYNSLDGEGKSAIRHGMMQKAFDTAIDETGNFSPAKYASNIEKLQKRLSIVLNKEDMQEINGLNKYMRFTQNAGDYASNIKTGQKAVGTIYGMAAGAGLASNPVATSLAGLSVVATKKLFRTKRGRSFMLALSKYPEGKTPPRELLMNIARYLAVKPSED